MSDKKRPSSKKMKDYENEKLEIANDLGVIHKDDIEVNVKIASQNESKYSKKNMTKHHNVKK